ncbi:Protein roadkill, partial [Stegodyphus mimosarum]
MMNYDLCYEWVIYDEERTFEEMQCRKGESLCSSRFGPANDRWSLFFYPLGTAGRGTDTVLRLCREQFGVPITLDGYLYIKTKDDTDDEKITVNISMRKFIHLPLNLSRNWTSLNEGNFTVKINIMVTEINGKDSDASACVKSINPHEKAVQTDDALNNLMSGVHISTLSNLSRDMQAMYEKKDTSDCTVKCDGVEFQVHKSILSARSSVFARMFEHTMTKITDSQITIMDIDSSVLEQFIFFIYTGRINIFSYAMARDLYSAADKYAVLDLKDICYKFLISSLSSSTALEILVLADTHNDALLRKVAMSYISSNFATFNTSEEWLSLSTEHSCLAMEVLSFTVTCLLSTKQN